MGQIFALRTTIGKEEQVLDYLYSVATKNKHGIYSIVQPHGLRGYIFIEAKNLEEAQKSSYGVPYSKGLVPGEVPIEQIESMLEVAKQKFNIQKNDLVEIISGPFKREQAKVTNVDKSKDKVIVELLNAAVAIPITLSIDDVKVIRREGEEN